MEVTDKIEEVTPAVQDTPVEKEPVKQAEKQTELPAHTSDRTTEQFEKLKEHNRRLNEAQQTLQKELEKKNQILQQFVGLQPQTQSVDTSVDQFVEVDPITGEKFVNQDKLNKVIVEAKKQAEEAKKSVQEYIQSKEQQEMNSQAVEAFRNYPMLNPEAEGFDKEFHKRTRAFIADSMRFPQEYGGRVLTFKEAADLANIEKERQQQKQQIEEKRAEKQSITQEPESVSTDAIIASRNENEELERLRERTRRGGDAGTWALADRLSRISHAGTPKSSQT